MRLNVLRMKLFPQTLNKVNTDMIKNWNEL